MLEAKNIIRHVQLKTSYIGSKTAKQKIHIKLADKPSGCVIWIYFDVNTLELGPFYFFGNDPGKPLKNLESAKISRHTRANKDGFKAERINIRDINKGSFDKYDSIDFLYKRLFG